jgi:SecD/SecF fusion protein
MHRESRWSYWSILIVFVACVYFLVPSIRYATFVSSTKEPVRQADMSNEAYDKAVTDYDLKKQSLQRNAIKLGLDLVGGVDVLLEVDKDRMGKHYLSVQRDNLIRRMDDQQIGIDIEVNDANDGLSLKMDDKANAHQVNNILRESIPAVFVQYDEAAFENTGQTVLRLSDSYVSSRVAESVDAAEKTIRNRVDQFGVTQPSVSVQANRSIRVQVPGEKDPEYVIKKVIQPAQLEFYLVNDDNESLVGRLFEEVPVLDAKGAAKLDNQGRPAKEWRLKAGQKLPAGWKGMRGVENRDAKGNALVTAKSIMYIVKNAPEITGQNLRDAYVQTNPTDLQNPVAVAFAFDTTGADRFRDITKKNVNHRLAVALDQVIYSAPNIRTVIPDGSGEITGGFSVEEARDLSLVLKAGALPADLKPIEKRAIGPTLGADSIRDSIRALIISSIFITAFMIVYYGMAGVIAVVALIINTLITLAALDMFDATLTLSGIGGMILTIGMAVDANILIYERIREELDGGRPLRGAISAGFNRAFAVIFDSNLTTILSALVLLQFGVGSLQGFALTMTFGLLANLYTGLLVTQTLCRLWFSMRGSLSLGALRFPKTNIDFIGIGHYTVGCSFFLAVGLLGFLIVRGGPEYAVDFKGGVLSEVRMLSQGDKNLSTDIKEALAKAGLSGDQAKVQKVISVSAENDYLIRLGLQADPNAPKGDHRSDVTYTQQCMTSALGQAFGTPNVEIRSMQGVNQEVGQGFQQIAWIVVVGTAITMLIYLWFRFELVFGVAAVVALIHDFLVTLGIITLFKVQISLDVVSALLILQGYSVNDTIVIFDRVRENGQTMLGHSFRDICNRAMNRSLGRTVIMSGTVVLVMIVMYFWGGYSLRPFALTLIVGGIFGTYSSDFVATPIVHWWNKRRGGELQDQLSRKGSVAASSSGQTSDLAEASAGAASASSGARRGRR